MDREAQRTQLARIVKERGLLFYTSTGPAGFSAIPMSAAPEVAEFDAHPGDNVGTSLKIARGEFPADLKTGDYIYSGPAKTGTRFTVAQVVDDPTNYNFVLLTVEKTA